MRRETSHSESAALTPPCNRPPTAGVPLRLSAAAAGFSVDVFKSLQRRTRCSLPKFKGTRFMCTMCRLAERKELLLDFCSDLISIYPSFEGSKAIECLQKPTRWSLWRSTYGTVGCNSGPCTALEPLFCVRVFARSPSAVSALHQWLARLRKHNRRRPQSPLRPGCASSE